MDNRVTCLVCNKQFKSIINSHLKKHNLTFEQYLLIYPNADIVCEETSNKLKQASIKHVAKFGFKKGHKINLGKKAWNKGLNKHTDKRVENYGNKLKNRSVSQDTKDKISNLARIGYQNNSRKKRFGPDNHMYGRKLTLEHKKKLLAAQKTAKMTRPEKYVQRIAKGYGFKFTGLRSFWLKFPNGRWKNPDFVKKDDKVAIEVFGSYYHKAEEVKEIIDLYESIGWKCIIIWDYELYPFQVHDSIEHLLNIEDIEPFNLEDFNYENWCHNEN